MHATQPPRAWTGIVLCGGRSSRMGVPKAELPFGGETMLCRVLRTLAEVVAERIVVAAPEQRLPTLPAGVRLLRDVQEGLGPLAGLAAGLAALAPDGLAFVTSCDAPLLKPAFVRRMFELLGEREIAVPVVDGFPHPLAAVYRARLLPQVQELLAQDRRRPAFLFDLADTRRVGPEELADVDPNLESLQNLNRPEDYLAALAATGETCPPDILARLRREEEGR